MTSLKIYGVPLSVHTRKVILTARLKSIPHEVVPVVPVIADSLPPDWRRISPTGLIPAIDDGGFTLADSTAIVLYLERTHPEPALLPPEPRDNARALFLDAWAGAALFRRVVHPLFHNQVVAPKIENQPGDADTMRTALDVAAPEALTYLESLNPPAFLLGDRISIADLAIVSNLIMFHYLGHRIDAARHPQLSAYFQRQLALPLFAAALEVEKPFVERMGLKGFR